MKKISFFLTSITLTVLLYSCGGVIGNIEKYRFDNVSIDSLKKAVARVYYNHPELKDFDTVKYKEGQGLGDGYYYSTIKGKEKKYFFKYAYVQYDPPYNNFVEIALISGGQYGEGLYLGKNIDF